MADTDLLPYGADPIAALPEDLRQLANDLNRAVMNASVITAGLIRMRASGMAREGMAARFAGNYAELAVRSLQDAYAELWKLGRDLATPERPSKP